MEPSLKPENRNWNDFRIRPNVKKGKIIRKYIMHIVKILWIETIQN